MTCHVALIQAPLCSTESESCTLIMRDSAKQTLSRSKAHLRARPKEAADLARREQLAA